MANDTKVAALFRSSTLHSHTKLEEQIVRLLRHGELTRYSIASKLERGVNCVCAPIKALLDAGVIEESERIKQPETGNLAWALRLKGNYEDVRKF